jgi:hypothetical protein
VIDGGVVLADVGCRCGDDWFSLRFGSFAIIPGQAFDGAANQRV